MTDTDNDSDMEQQKPGNISHFKCTKCNTSAASATQIDFICWCSTCKNGSYARCSTCSSRTAVRSSYKLECTNDSCTVKVSMSPGAEDDNIKVRDRFKKDCAAEEYPVGCHKHSTIDVFIKSSLSKIPVTGNLLAHAKVHVFAEKYLIKELAQMASHLLHREITEYAVDKVGSSNVVRTIQYAYENSDGGNGPNDTSSLKHLMLKHSALKSDRLLQCKAFCNLLREGGDFGVDFAKMLSKHII